MLKASYAPALNRSRLSGGSEAFVTGCEAQEYGRRQSALPFAARGDPSHARTTLSRPRTILGIFSLLSAVGGLVIIFRGRAMAVRIFFRAPRGRAALPCPLAGWPSRTNA